MPLKQKTAPQNTEEKAYCSCFNSRTATGSAEKTRKGEAAKNSRPEHQTASSATPSI